MENILMYLENGMTMLVAISVYMYLVASLYPYLTLRTVWKTHSPYRILGNWITGDREIQESPTGDTAMADRGLRKLVFPDGRAILYEPALRMRRYIRCYALIKQDGCTFIKCRIHPRIACIRYDVATFDRKGRLLDVLNVSERVTEYGYTQTVRLPRATAYACVTLRRVDRMYEGRESTVGYSRVGIGMYMALSVITAAMMGNILHGCLAEIMETLPVRGDISSPGLTLVAAAVLGGLSAAWVVFMHSVHAKKDINR